MRGLILLSGFIIVVSLGLVVSNNPTWVPDQDGDGYRDLVFQNGILIHPQGDTVYLEGEGCTVNYNPDPKVMQDRFQWCMDHHQ
jgi:hypothetical protein